jgi:hypothetical protein
MGNEQDRVVGHCSVCQTVKRAGKWSWKRNHRRPEASAHAARNCVHWINGQAQRRGTSQEGRRAPQAAARVPHAHVFQRKNIRHVDGPRSPTTLTNHHSTVEFNPASSPLPSLLHLFSSQGFLPPPPVLSTGPPPPPLLSHDTRKPLEP